MYIAEEERHHAVGRDATFPWSRAFSNFFGGETKRVTGPGRHALIWRDPL